LQKRPKVILQKNRDLSVRKFHPWIFSGALAKIEGHAAGGEIVDVYAASGEYLATGHYGSESIAVRVFSFTPVTDEHRFIEQTISAAYQLRETLGLIDSRVTTAFRLFNAEGDGLPGLIIDLYDRTAVLQCHSPGVYRWRENVVAVLQKLFPNRLVAVFNQSLKEKENKTEKNLRADEYLLGGPQEVVIKENGLSFAVDVEGGQKTGFYLDQRENRDLVKKYAHGRNMLNAFSYTGGFTVYALSGEARNVCSVDISKNAIEALDKNISLNFSQTAATAVVADCLEYLRDLGDSYDLIILDPPAFVKHRGALKGGLVGYETINYHCFRQIAPRGLLFTFSCSQFVDRPLFKQIVQKAAERAGRKVRVLHELSQAPCHPVSIYHPEGVYLKGLMLCVE
jgi:23S rRNA (cytosine1962-C5)-methyltransferase